jgi:hypothetical protein
MEIYTATRAKRQQHESGLGKLYPLGFKILHAPPRPRPPVLFIGIQPDGSQADEFAREMHIWPPGFDYDIASFPLATYLRGLFRDDAELFFRCNVTYANFFRAPRDNAKRQADLAWEDVHPATRKDIQSFCAEQLKSIVDVLQPRCIVVMGMDILKRPERIVGTTLSTFANVESELFGIPAIRVREAAPWRQTGGMRAERDAAIRKIATISS